MKIGWKTQGMLGGVIGGAAATGVMFLARFAWEGPLLPEQITQQVFASVPMELFSLTVGLLGKAAKWVAFWGTVGAQIAVMGLIGGFFAGSGGHGERVPSWGSILVLAVALWGAAVALVLPSVEAGFFGARLPSGIIASLGWLLVESFLYALIVRLYLGQRTVSREKPYGRSSHNEQP